jgi:hypothetical protein
MIRNCIQFSFTEMESIRKREGNDGKNKWGLFMKGLECLTDFKFPTVVNKESAC